MVRFAKIGLIKNSTGIPSWAKQLESNFISISVKLILSAKQLRVPSLIQRNDH